MNSAAGGAATAVGAYGSLGGGDDEEGEGKPSILQEMIRDSKALPHLFWVLIVITLLMYVY